MTESLHKKTDNPIDKTEHYKLNYFYPFWICLVLTLLTIAVFNQVCTHDFISYDDPVYVYKNPNIQTGITLKTIKWAFTANYANNWHPLTWLSHMRDWQNYRSNPAGHHLTNLILHIANTLLLFLVLKKMTSSLWPSAFVAALFALHPLHVESVAWIAERKDVLSIFFWLLTMLAYARFASRPNIIDYLLTVVFLALGLMAKPMLVTLPFVLLLLDYWPLDRLSLTMSLKRGESDTKHSLPYLLIEKIPLFALVFASCIITFTIQKKTGAVNMGEKSDFLIRLTNASISYLEYIIKMIWPVRLAVFYPHPGRNISFLYAVISAVLLLTVTILILRFAKNRRYLVMGWFWYLGTLVPVIGFVQVGSQAMADRYSYITLTGLFIIIAWGLPELLAKWRYRKIALWGASLIVLSILAILTHLQQQYWKNSMTLFQHALAVTSNNQVAYSQIADILLEQNKFNEAIPLYEKAIQIVPYSTEMRFNLGIALAKSGKLAEAAQEYEKILTIQPKNAFAHNNLGLVFSRQGKLDEAIEHFNQAIQIAPDYASARSNLQSALAKKQKLQNKPTEDLFK